MDAVTRVCYNINKPLNFSKFISFLAQKKIVKLFSIIKLIIYLTINFEFFILQPLLL